MKTKITFIAVLVMVTSSLTLLKGQTSIGLSGGVNYAWYTFSGAKDNQDTLKLVKDASSGLPLLYITVPIEYRINPHFALQPEMAFLQKGTRTNINLDAETFASSDLRINYIQLPLLAKILFGTDKIGWNFYAGPSLSYAVGGKIKSTLVFQGQEIALEQKINWEEINYHRFDAGIIGGMGLTLKAGPGNIAIDIRYQFDLTKPYSAPSDIIPHNSGIGFLAGYSIPLVKKG